MIDRSGSGLEIWFCGGNLLSDANEIRACEKHPTISYIKFGPTNTKVITQVVGQASSQKFTFLLVYFIDKLILESCTE